MKASDLILTVHKRAGHVFALAFTPEKRVEAYAAIWRWASDETLPFNWRDALRMGNDIRKELEAWKP
jgi:hypothetical protein